MKEENRRSFIERLKEEAEERERLLEETKERIGWTGDESEG